MYDTIIIGAGMSALAAGIRLANFERRVCLLERHTTIGGLNSFYRRDGRDFDVGLHAVTNYFPSGSRRGLLPLLLRQLRFRADEFELAPQVGSTIEFPGVRLRFTNDFSLLESEVRRQFPDQIDALGRMVAALADYPQFGEPACRRSARAFVAEHLNDPLLAEMLLWPVLCYGSAQEQDMDFGQFSIVFRSLFLEGLARPAEGVRLILRKLVRHYKQLGGELRLRCGVKRLAVRNGAVQAVVLDDGTELAARRILSSAGWQETARLCGSEPEDGPPAASPPTGSISLLESISVLGSPAALQGHDQTMIFYSDTPRFAYRQPDDLANLGCGVICCPHNFRYAQPLPEATVRVTALANHARWTALNQPDYQLAKRGWYDKMVASAVRYVPDFRADVVASDVFTPVTIQRFTGHAGGAVYGSPEKRFDGSTPWSNLFLCGNDQGLMGIVGALFSGISMANRHILHAEAAAASTS